MKGNLLFKGTNIRLQGLCVALLLLCSTTLHAAWPSYPGTAGITGSYNVLDESSEKEINTVGSVEYNLNGPGAVLTYSAKRTFAGGNYFYCAQYVDGQWSDLSNPDLEYKNYKNYTSNINPRATKIKFYTKTGATLFKYIKNVKVTMAAYAGSPAAGSLDFGSATIGSSDKTQTTSFDWSNVGAYAVSITGDDADLFTASVSNNAAAGKYGTATVSVTYKHTEVGTHAATLHLGSYTIALKGTTEKLTQTIEWETPDTIKTTESLTLNATAQGQIVYTNENEDIATLHEDNTVTFLKAGELKLTATAAETENYKEATLTKTIQVVLVEPTVEEWPTLGEITYGDTLKSVVLTGGKADIEGKFSIGEEDLTHVPEGGEQQISVVFTPANTAWYDTVSTTLPLQVNPAKQEIVWEPVASILTTTTLALDATAKTAISYTVETEDIATLNDDNSLTILKAGVLRLTATAAQTANYQSATLTKEITIELATPVITTLPTLAQLTYGQKLSEAVLSGGEADAEGTFSLTESDLEQVLNAGEYTLKVQFTPTNTKWYNTVDTVVVLTIAKAEQVITWEQADKVLATESIVLNASAIGAITYTNKSEDIATINAADNTVTILKAGVLAIVVNAAETENYNAATLTKDITIERVTPEITNAPSLAPIEVGKTLADVKIMQGTASVEGWFGWASDVELDTVLNKTGSFTYYLIFTPTNDNLYNSVENIEVTLQVVDKTVTGIESNTLDSQAQKVLRNGQILILRNGKTYDTTGARVR